MRSLILSGGVAHAFSDTSDAILAMLAALGIESRIAGDIESALIEDLEYQFMVFNSPSTRARARAAVLSHLARGGGLLALHGAVISFGDWPEWRQILGAGWIPGKSGHPKRSAVDVIVHTDSHPILASSSHGDVDHPMLWPVPMVEGDWLTPHPPTACRHCPTRSIERCSAGRFAGS